jgi:hypothetical protein
MIRPFLFFLFSLLDHFGRSGTEMSDESVRPIHPNQKAGERTTTTAVTGRGVGVVARFGLLGSTVRFSSVQSLIGFVRQDIETEHPVSVPRSVVPGPPCPRV